MSTITQYTGTFVKRDGTRRTMNFFKASDLPKGMIAEGAKDPYARSNGEIQVVYDADKRGFRTFNYGTVVGQVSTKSVNFSFDKQ